MFRKLFGKGNKDKRNKKRLSPSASTKEGLMQSHPMYEYAMKEYAQTVPHNNASIIDDDGRLVRQTFSMNDEDADEETIARRQQVVMEAEAVAAAESGAPVDNTNVPNASSVGSGPSSILRASSYKSSSEHAGGGGGGDTPLSRQQSRQSTVGGSMMSSPYHHPFAFSPKAEYAFSEDEESQSQRPRKRSPTQRQYNRNHPNFEPPMPDTTYEEWYGDAYVGGPMKYIYPSGYQSMRPRSGPWKLSIVVCLCFTWLSVFIIGHCSDRFSYNNYTNNNNNNSNNNNADNEENNAVVYDDQFAIETKWCGSRLLYWMWVVSMLITGLATAYCSVIGYIKVRDFAVANSRSQPPGVVGAGWGKSDYYVQIVDDNNNNANNNPNLPPHMAGGPIHPSQYHKTIYQADGTPQFWGNQIYRPTQAAVAITSR